MELRFGFKRIKRGRENILSCRFVGALYLFLTFGVSFAREAHPGLLNTFPYHAGKADGTMVLDGRLQEPFWKKATNTEFSFAGNSRIGKTQIRIAWDETYLYLGFTCDDPDIRGVWGLRDKDMTRDNRKSLGLAAEDNDSLLAFFDGYVSLTLASNQNEGWRAVVGVNVLNNTLHYLQKNGERYSGWNCPGLRTAVFIEGTINNSEDIDQGWTAEMAIPWKALPPSFEDLALRRGQSGLLLSATRSQRFGPKYEEYLSSWPEKSSGAEQFAMLDPTENWENRNTADSQVVEKGKDGKFERMFAWMDLTDEEIAKQARDAGVTDIIGNFHNSEKVALAKKYGFKIYQRFDPPSARAQNPGKEFMKRREQLYGNDFFGTMVEDFPGRETQVSDLRAFCILGMAGSACGGEPSPLNIFGDGIWDGLPCFSGDESLRLTKNLLEKICQIDGLDGVAFDYIGYANYRDCQCDVCTQLYQKYIEENASSNTAKSRIDFFLRELVNYNNQCADFVKKLRPDMIVVTHVYPVFLPEPLYGNRLKVDFCGQTAAWYSIWPTQKIFEYGSAISREESRFFQQAKGVPFVGFYDGAIKLNFPFKSPARIELELKTILSSGARMLMVCDFGDVLKNPEVAKVFKKYCAWDQGEKIEDTGN